MNDMDTTDGLGADEDARDRQIAAGTDPMSVEEPSKWEGVLANIASGVPTEDEWRSAADYMEFVAEVLTDAGVPRPEHYADEDALDAAEGQGRR